MQIQLPDDAKELILNQARSSGFTNVADYMLSLVRQDQQSREFAESVARDPQIEALAQEGIESGPAVALDMEAIRREYRERSGKSG